MDQLRQTGASKLPAGLAGVMNAPEENRDSAYYSSTDASSKHTSAASYNGVNVLSPTTHGFYPPHADKTPSPTTPASYQHHMASSSTTNMSVAAVITTPSTMQGGPSINHRRPERPYSLEAGPANTPSMLDPHDPMSRRESVDSRINHEFGGMRLATSPYASNNQSTAPTHNGLQQQRNPRPGLDNLSLHRISNGYQPNMERNPDPHSRSARTAPAITGPATSHIARAAEPTKGQAWAFPEEDVQRIAPQSAVESIHDSRRSSIAESLASSQYTTESRLPPGQRRLDEGVSPMDYQRMSTVSGEFPVVHHHSLQHKHLSDIQDDDMSSQSGAQPYSRTPELRVSHKLAERKRRTEMKELFEQLRDLMPQERGSKASKWEILTKAIAEHQRQAETIKYLQQGHHSIRAENDVLRRENAALRSEIAQSRTETSNYAPGQAPNAGTSASVDAYARPGHRAELPPLRSLGGSVSGPSSDSMTGLQYESRPSAYRGVDGRI